MVDIKIFITVDRGGALVRGKCFLGKVTILFNQCNNTNITYQQFYSCLR